jgi:hypothetical protein
MKDTSILVMFGIAMGVWVGGAIGRRAEREHPSIKTAAQKQAEACAMRLEADSQQKWDAMSWGQRIVHDMNSEWNKGQPAVLVINPGRDSFRVKMDRDTVVVWPRAYYFVGGGFHSVDVR